MEFYLPPFLSFIAAIGGLAVAYMTVRRKIRTELLAEFKKELRAERLHSYKEFWKSTQIFSLYSLTSGFDLSACESM